MKPDDNLFPLLPVFLVFAGLKLCGSVSVCRFVDHQDDFLDGPHVIRDPSFHRARSAVESLFTGTLYACLQACTVEIYACKQAPLHRWWPRHE